MWYYSTDGKQQGPVDDATLDKLSKTGLVTPETYVWKEGMGDWAPLSQARPAKAIGTVAAAAESCSICGKTVGADNLIDLVGNRVCAECKPLAVQSLKEGAGIQSKAFTAWRDGKRVVAFDKTALPARCYKCNHESVGAPMKRKLYWHHPAWYLLLILRFLPYLIVAIFIRKRATLDVYLCQKHMISRRYSMIGAWLGVILAVLMTIGGGVYGLPWLTITGVFVFIGAIVASIVGARVVRPAKIKKDGTVWLSGSGKEFLASLPEWTGPSRNA